jgi:hypothetical protein
VKGIDGEVINFSSEVNIYEDKVNELGTEDL